MSNLDVERLRAETPGCGYRIHLNNAGAALMPVAVVKAVKDHIALESEIGGYEAADARHSAIRSSYQAVADLIGTKPTNIAFTENATASYAQALSSIPLGRGDVIVTTRNDYVSNQIQFLSLQSRLGVKIVRAPDVADGGVDVGAMRELIRRHRPKVVCVTHVPTNSGLVQDVRAIGTICSQEDVLYLIDACQSVGQLPIDVAELQCDFLSATARKFLRGPRGLGFLYVSDRVLEDGLEPLFLDMRGADWTDSDAYTSARDAKRFENWEFPYALVLGLGEAARYANGLGLRSIAARVGMLASTLRNRLSEIERLRVLDRGVEKCAIVSVGVDGRDPNDIMMELRERGINTGAQVRIYAVIDYDAKKVTSSLRISPHYYNTEAEINDTVLALREVLAS